MTQESCARRTLLDVPIASLRSDRLRRVSEPGQYAGLLEVAAAAGGHFRGRVFWNVNSTAHGGGVAEMLRPLLGYVRGAGVDARWVVIDADPAFLRVTKRLHHRLHGEIGDGGDLGGREERVYRETMAANAAELVPRLGGSDVVVLHDPQTAGMAPALRAAGARVVWRAHIGADSTNDLARDAWRFLEPFVAEVDAYVFSRRAHTWDVLDATRVHVVPPSIDALAPKNVHLDAAAVPGILAAAGVLDAGAVPACAPLPADGAGRAEGGASVIGGPVPAGAPLVAQVSRWDRLKDPVGVMAGFAAHVAPRCGDVHLALVGPDVRGVSDDPEGAAVLGDVTEERASLPRSVRDRIHLVSLPMDDEEHNATLVNAVQRHAAVVVQKSLAEGFGLTVAEAMWKSRPVLASRVGGIQDQIEDGVSGLLVDPDDLAAFGRGVVGLLDDPEGAEAMGAAARVRCQRHFLAPRHLLQYFELASAL